LRPTVSSRDCAAPRGRDELVRAIARITLRRTHPCRSQVRRPPAPQLCAGASGGRHRRPDSIWSTSPPWPRPTIGLRTASAAGPSSRTTSRTASAP
jgi:hypothetical protein